MVLKAFSPEGFYPTPRRRVESPQPTRYQVGDIVKILVGPATGRLGRVVVDRNGNYEDFEPYVDKEGIGVSVVESMDAHPIGRKVLSELGDSESLVHTIVRWFDGAEQLELDTPSRG